MRNPNSVEEIAEIHSLLKDIKKEYNEGIREILKRDNPIYRNDHILPKLEKIQINRGLGLAGQNTNMLKKSIEEFKSITGQKPLITKSKKAIAGFKIRENMELGIVSTLRGEKMYAFLTKLVFFTFAQIRDFRGLSVRSFDKAGNYSFGLKEQLIFPEINYEDVDQNQGFTISLVFASTTPRKNSKSVDRIFNNMSLLKFFKFPLNDAGFYEKYDSLNEVSQIWDKKKQLRRKRWSQVQE
jgi:large subunit ribosomal protein L5